MTNDSSNAKGGALAGMPAAHLDVVRVPGSVDTSRSLPKAVQVVVVIFMPLFFIVCFTLAYVSSLHEPLPNSMAIELAGPASITNPIAEQLADEFEGAFAVTESELVSSARELVEMREVVGAVVVNADPAGVTVYSSSAGGVLAARVVQQVGDEVAAQLGTTAEVVDVAPLPDGDPGGVSVFYFLIVCTIASFLSITAVSQVIAKPSNHLLILTAVGAGLFVPAVGFAVTNAFVEFGLTAEQTWSVLGIGALYATTIGLLAGIFVKVAGQGAVLLEILFLVALNFPSSGASVPASMLPPFWQGLHEVWLGAGAYEWIRNLLFFPDAATQPWATQLLLWFAAAVLGFAVIITVGALRQRRKPLEPAEVKEVKVDEHASTAMFD